MDRQDIISAQDLSYRYETANGVGPYVLKDVELAVERGTFVSIIGHNGSGKSTLAKLLNALLVPTDGVVIACGFDTRREETIWEIRRQVGMVFQNPDNQLVGTTVEDDVAFGLENLGIDPGEMRVRVDEALASVHMEPYADTQPHRLSGGQKQRVAIAGILAMQPVVLILDEATAMLDPEGRREVMALVHRLHREKGITVINITHFPEETLASDRVIVMHEGRIIADGTPRDVYRDVERLRAIGLEAPFAVRMRYRLAEGGITLPPVYNEGELVEELCRLLLKT